MFGKDCSESEHENEKRKNDLKEKIIVLKYYRWQQLQYTKDGHKHWQLVNKETGMVVINVKLSKFADPKFDYWVRKKIQNVYERYDDKVWFNSLRVF